VASQNLVGHPLVAIGGGRNAWLGVCFGVKVQRHRSAQSGSKWSKIAATAVNLQIDPQSATMVVMPDKIGKSSTLWLPDMQSFYVRLGSLAEVHTGRSPVELSRGRRVIVRTNRGVELGEVVRRCDHELGADQSTVSILRPTTDEDELLIRRLDRHKREAVEACRTELSESGSSSILLDVDQLFDGGTLVMHFLGPVDEVAESVTKKVVDRYESIVRTRHFSKLLRDGCGPACGTEAGGGCGGSCTGCAVASACI
jgi:hypothetical protein